MSATSGSVATTRIAASAEAAVIRTRRAAHAARVISTLREAMSVTPEEGGPLQGEALVVVGPRQLDLVDLEAQAVELRREPGGEGGVRLLPRGISEGVLRVVAADSERVAATQEGLEVGIAAVAARVLLAEDRIARDRVDADLDVLELLVVPVPLRPEHEALVELARARLVPQRDIGPIEVALVVLRRCRGGRSELEVQRLAEVEVGRRMHEEGQLALAAPALEALVAQLLVAFRADRVVHAGGHAHVVLDRREPGELGALGLGLAAEQAIDRRRPIHEGQRLVVPVRQAPHVREEAPALDGEVPGQRRRHQRSLLDVEALVAGAVDGGVATQERIDGRRDEELTGGEREVRARAGGVVLQLAVHHEADRRVVDVHGRDARPGRGGGSARRAGLELCEPLLEGFQRREGAVELLSGLGELGLHGGELFLLALRRSEARRQELPCQQQGSCEAGSHATSKPAGRIRPARGPTRRTRDEDSSSTRRGWRFARLVGRGLTWASRGLGRSGDREGRGARGRRLHARGGGYRGRSRRRLLRRRGAVSLGVRIDGERGERRARLAGGAARRTVRRRVTGRDELVDRSRAVMGVREQDPLDAREQTECEERSRQPSASGTHGEDAR